MNKWEQGRNKLQLKTGLVQITSWGELLCDDGDDDDDDDMMMMMMMMARVCVGG